MLVWLAACTPTLDLVDDKDVDTDADTDPPSVDTDPPDSDLPPLEPCAVSEVEPNAAPTDATPLPTEVRACGGFADRFDVDSWSFALVEENWLGVDVEAFAIGSEADVRVTLSSADLGVTVIAGSWVDRPDVHLRFPSPPGAYLLTVTQEADDPGGGDDHFYEVLATSTKRPVDYDITEAEPNTLAAPQALGSARAVFGQMDAAGDEDWYALDVPVGAHRVRFDVDALVAGSRADLALMLRDAGGTELGSASFGDAGFDLDPALSWEATLGGTLRVGVRSEGRVTDVGRPFWYVLKVELEAAP